MASKRRIRRKACSSKVRHASRADALTAMHKVIAAGKKHGGRLNVYYCQFCGGYHFGHAAGSSTGRSL